MWIVSVDAYHAILKEGEWKLKYFNPNIGRTKWRNKMEHNDMCIENKYDFHKDFYHMADQVEKLFAYYERRMEKEGKKKRELQQKIMY